MNKNHETKGKEDHDKDEDRPAGGWLYLTRNESVQYMIEALLSLPARREFNQKELATMAGVSRQSVSRHIEVLRTLNIIKKVPETTPQRYRFDQDSPVSKKIIELDAAIAEERGRGEDGREAIFG